MKRLAILAFAAAVTVSPAAAQSHRALAPPTPEQCATLQNGVQPAIRPRFVRAPGQVRVFGGRDISGPGCVLTARGLLTQFDPDGAYWDQIQRRLGTLGWRADPAMVADGGGGQALGFRRGDLYLSAEYEEDDGGMCDPEGPPSNDCDRPPERTQVTIRLGLARGVR